MPRTVTVSVAPELTDRLISELGRSEGVISVQAFRGASTKPAGDVLNLLVANSHLFGVMRTIEEMGLADVSSITANEPQVAYSRTSQDVFNVDIIESVWEESEMFLQKSSTVSFNFLLLMAFSGVLAAVGLSSGVLHLVIAAMLIAPGFEPMVNIPLGIVLSKRWLISHGLRSTLIGYGAFVAAAAAAFHALWLLDQTSPISFVSQPMVQFWAGFNLSTFIVSVIAAAAGIVIIPTHRSVLTAGVMVALALIPGAAIFAICLSTGQWEYALRGIGQWTLDTASIVITGLIIFWAKKMVIHKRGSLY